MIPFRVIIIDFYEFLNFLTTQITLMGDFPLKKEDFINKNVH